MEAKHETYRTHRSRQKDNKGVSQNNAVNSSMHHIGDVTDIKYIINSYGSFAADNTVKLLENITEHFTTQNKVLAGEK